MMCRLLAIVILLWPLSAARGIALKDDPDYSFAWNAFNSVAMVNDSIAVAAAGDGLLSVRWDAHTVQLSPVIQFDYRNRIGRFVVADSIVVSIENGTHVTFWDRQAFPQIVMLGQADLPDSTLDFVIRGRDIYVASGFRGLLHCRFDTYSSIAVVDSSQIGVHIVAVHLFNDHLLAADDYNGILDYAIGASGTPQFESRLDMPFPVNGFEQMGDTLLVTTSNLDTLSMAVKTNQSWHMIGAIAPPFGCEKVYVSDTLVVVIARDMSGISLLSRRNLSVLDFASAGLSALRYPSLFQRAGNSYLLAVGSDGGFLLFYLDYSPMRSASQVYPISGEVKAMVLHGSYLAAGASTGWVRTWKVNSEFKVGSPAILFDNGGYIGDMHETNFGLATLNIEYNKMNFVSDTGGKLTPFNTIFLGHPTTGFCWFAGGSPPAVGIWSANSLYLWHLLADQLMYASKLTVPVSIKSACIINNLVVVSSAKFGIQVYTIGPNFELWYTGFIRPEGDIELLTLAPGWSNCLIGFSNDRVYRLNFSKPSIPAIDTAATLPFSVSSASLHDTLLFTTGYNTTAIFAISPTAILPRLLASCSRGGSLVTGNEDVMFLTTGKSILGFDLHGPTGIEDPPTGLPSDFGLVSNYPNPFNPSTTIEFSLESRQQVQVVIYNSLGRMVRQLVDKTESAGVHRVEWDGRDESGQEVASGVYFCRVVTSEKAGIAKMVLIR